MTRQEQLTEDLGVHLEKMEFTPIEARVFALLLLSKSASLDFEEIMFEVKASKSSTSKALTALQFIGAVKYMTKSGDRKRYFKADIEYWENRMINGTKNFKSLNSYLKQVLELRGDMQSEGFNEKIQKVVTFQDFINQKMTIAIEEWNSKKYKLDLSKS